MKPFHQAKTL